jgi:predicted ATP-grasp superfamily ATP-dependent carboligase
MTHRVFVSEFISGGSWPEPELPASLAREGQAMLLAVVREVLVSPSIELRTTWDKRLGKFPGDFRNQNPQLSIVEVGSIHEELCAYDSCCRWATDVLVIAPEFHGILADRRKRFDQQVDAESTRWLGCDLESIRLCGDKLRLSSHLQNHDIPTVPAHAFTSNDDISFPFPIVIKPRCGAGSIETRRVASQVEMHQLAGLEFASEFDFIVQPFVRGELVSCSAIVEQGRLVSVFPPGRQVVSQDGAFKYLGMDLHPDISNAWQIKATNLIQRCCEAVSGLHGYIGFDLIVPARNSSSLVVLEINPRITTGFAGWQQLHTAQILEHSEPDTKSLLGSHFGQPTASIECDRSIRFRVNSITT